MWILNRFFFLQTRKADDDEDDGAGDAKKSLTSDDLSLTDRAAVTQVGTTTPVEDFNALIADNQPFASVAQQLESVILKLLRASFGSSTYEKICDCLEVYRSCCLVTKKQPNLYNDFLQELKMILKVMNCWSCPVSRFDFEAEIFS